MSERARAVDSAPLCVCGIYAAAAVAKAHLLEGSVYKTGKKTGSFFFPSFFSSSLLHATPIGINN